MMPEYLARLTAEQEKSHAANGVLASEATVAAGGDDSLPLKG